MAELMVVTGAGGALGSELLKQALDKNYVVLALLRNRNGEAKLRKKIRHPNLHYALADFALPDCAEKLYAAIEKARAYVLKDVERCDVSIVFNAACYPMAAAGDLPARELQTWRHVMTVNALSVQSCLVRLSSLARQNVLKSVLAVSSLSAYVGLPGDACYAASKSALERIIESYALQWCGCGVSAGLLIPSSFASNLQDEAAPGGRPASTAAAVARKAMAALEEGLQDFRYPADPVAEKILTELSSVKRSELLGLAKTYC